MDESRDHGLKVLTLDGEADIRVGVLSALFSLLDMMRRAAVDHPELTADEANVDSSTNPNPEALPCKCFDLIVGSGDGGWVAIMLGRLSMTTSQVIQLYLQVRASIHNSYPFNGPLHTWNTGAMATAFEACLKLIVTTSMKDVEENLQFLNPTCYVVALAVHEESDAQHPAYFRNYVARANSCPNCPIWFAMRAVASSKIFPPALMGSTGQRFLAASHFSFNNPVNQAISEAIDLAKHLKITGPPLACLVSLGAGHPGVKAINILELEKTAIRLTQGAEAAHEQALNFLKAATDLSQEAYFRVNVEQGLQTAECQKITLEAVRTHTESYLQKSQIKDLMINIVDHILSGYARQTDIRRSGSQRSIPPEDPASDFELMHIYTEGIYRHGHGLPMWNPRPFKKVVDVGDLGYIDDSGSFITLFNITVPPRGQQEFQTPTGFQHFSPTPPLNILVREASITRRYLKSGIDVDVPQLRYCLCLLLRIKLSDNRTRSSTCTMRWNIQRGAIVILNEKPKKLYITQSQPLLNYIAKHQEQWYQFLQGHSGCPAEVINSSRLLLVTGVHRTFSWSLGAWSRSLPSHSLSCTLPTSDGMAIDWHPDPAPGIRIGPLSPNRVQNIGDESLFVEGYRISRRNRRHQDLRTGVPVDAGDKTLSKLRGLMKDFTCFGSSSSEEHGPAPPSTSLPSSPTSHSADIQADSLQFIGNTELPRHPLDGLIDRVFSALPDIQTAIIHDHDWLRLAKWNEPRYEPSHSLIKQNIITDGTCAYFGFSSLEFPFLDLGPVIAKHAIRLSPDTVRRLCLASKQLHSLCTPILYYRIQFSQTEKLHNFFDAISSNPNLGQHVRHFYAEEVTIPSSAEFKYCSSLYTLALFSFCQDMQGAKHLLPPSVRHLACDPGYFTALTSPFISSKNTFQSITHLHLLTKLPAIQMWSWLGQNNMPVLTHLAVEHHFDSSLQDASQELIPLVTEHLSAHIKVCMLLLVNSNRTLRNSVQNTPIDRTHGLRKILDRASISLSDGTVDERVVLAATSVEPLWSLGYLLTVHLNEIRQPWATSSPSLWVRAEKVLHDRKVGGILPAEYYDGGETKRALDTIRGLFDFQPLQEYSCLEETHEKVLKPIENWVDNVNVPNIFWLEGYPGAEKTAISICLEQYLAKTGRLGASCFFRHEDASHHRLDSLIRSIAFQLANNHDSIKDTLVQAVNSGAIHFDSGPSNLFEKLICDSLAPCSNFSDSIVFVIDAMDEFGLTEKVRLRLKNILFPRWIQLPRQCKLFITSRFQSEPAPFKVDVNKFGVRSGSGFGFYYNIL